MRLPPRAAEHGQRQRGEADQQDPRALLGSRLVVKFLLARREAVFLSSLAGGDVFEMQRRQLRRLLGPACKPGLGLGYLRSVEQQMHGLFVGLPLDRALHVARVIEDPIEVEIERFD